MIEQFGSFGRTTKSLTLVRTVRTTYIRPQDMLFPTTRLSIETRLYCILDPLLVLSIALHRVEDDTVSLKEQLGAKKPQNRNTKKPTRTAENIVRPQKLTTKLVSFARFCRVRGFDVGNVFCLRTPDGS